MSLATPPVVLFQTLPNGLDLPPPAYQTAGAAGADMRAAIPAGAPIILESGARALIPLGVALALPSGWEAQIRPRSGLALRHGLTVLNAPGTIDSDYRGEICALLVNLGESPVTVRRGMRVAQIVIAPAPQAIWRACGALDHTPRGAGGFGSTGVEETMP